LKFRTDDEIGIFMQNVGKKGMVMTLDPLLELCKRLGNPQNDTSFVHIAGTNGKGSVLSMTSSCLEKAGYRTGRFFSPQVFSCEPTVSINGNAPDEILRRSIMTEIIGEYEKMQEEGLETPTSFEIEFLYALMCFSREKCDIAVIECGMGGRDDATNIVRNEVCVITSIGYDHMKFLGNTITEIAGNKAGIFTSGCIAVSEKQAAEVIEVLRRKAAEKGCRFEVCGDVENIVPNGLSGQSFDYSGKRYSISLCGEHQCRNAATAIQTMYALREKGFEVSDENISDGIAETVWHGRFECIMQNPTVIIDGGHNTAAAETFVKCVEDYLGGRKIILVFGILRDKQYREVADIVSPIAERIITFTPPSERALNGRELAVVCSEYARTEYAESPEDAVRMAMKTAVEIGCDDCAICAFGSLYSLDRLRDSFMKTGV
jgi:dihydrofolate synthase/folylpolyglutamate synthase